VKQDPAAVQPLPKAAIAGPPKKVAPFTNAANLIKACDNPAFREIYESLIKVVEGLNGYAPSLLRHGAIRFSDLVIKY
jgi:hypothetical protein